MTYLIRFRSTNLVDSHQLPTKIGASPVFNFTHQNPSVTSSENIQLVLNLTSIFFYILKKKQIHFLIIN